jgi:hypothetical protein
MRKMAREHAPAVGVDLDLPDRLDPRPLEAKVKPSYPCEQAAVRQHATQTMALFPPMFFRSPALRTSPANRSGFIRGLTLTSFRPVTFASSAIVSPCGCPRNASSIAM